VTTCELHSSQDIKATVAADAATTAVADIAICAIFPVFVPVITARNNDLLQQRQPEEKRKSMELPAAGEIGPVGHHRLRQGRFGFGVVAAEMGR